ncbi:hypothetical protein [Calothrix sp. NIES-2100]|uniref:hypothetical protein n=1 Tax=Calothrix sp. NIES-2100 TaxID=1954172 RepID=UPI0030DB72D7
MNNSTVVILKGISAFGLTAKVDFLPMNLHRINTDRYILARGINSVIAPTTVANLAYR